MTNYRFCFRWVIYSTLVLSSLATSTFAGNQHKDDFYKKLYEPITLRHYASRIERPRRELSKQDKKDLIGAKDTLHKYLASYKDEGSNPLKFLSESLKENYKDRYDLYQKEYRVEDIEKIEIYDFVIRSNGDREIILYVGQTESTEGEVRIVPTAYAFKKRQNKWKVSRFGSNISNWQIESK